MSLLPLHDRDRNMPEPQGHLVGFVESHADFIDIFRSLSEQGFDEAEVTVLCGEDGIHLLKRMLGDPRWGPTAESVLQQGMVELGRGHCAVIIDANDREQAMAVVDTAKPFSAHGFTYFGQVVDEKLTA